MGANQSTPSAERLLEQYPTNYIRGSAKGEDTVQEEEDVSMTDTEEEQESSDTEEETAMLGQMGLDEAEVKVEPQSPVRRPWVPPAPVSPLSFKNALSWKVNKTSLPQPKGKAASRPYVHFARGKESAEIKSYSNTHDSLWPSGPRVELAAHRYWVIVMPEGKHNASSQKTRKHSLWFKANRLTTVETVARTYGESVALEDFALFQCGRRVPESSRMEELDLLHNKRIIFQVVPNSELGHQGNELPEFKRERKNVAEGAVAADAGDQSV